jgi:hypothetical protein
VVSCDCATYNARNGEVYCSDCADDEITDSRIEDSGYSTT